MKKININTIIGFGSFWIVNKKIAKELGIEEALFLSDLISRREYFKKKHSLKEGWFYNTMAATEEITNLSPHKQRRFIKDMINRKFIETKMMGLPQKQYFKINDENIYLFLKEEHTD
jgi:hypothetical protein